MNGAAGGAAGPVPRAILGDLPDVVWPELLALVRTALHRATHEPRRLSPFAGWHPDKFDGPEVRRAVVQVLATDARFRADLRDVLTDEHPELAASAERGVVPPSGRHEAGAVAAALVAWDRWEALSTFGDRVAAEQVRRSAPVAGERPADPPAGARGGRSSHGDAAGPEIGRLESRIRELEQQVQHRDRRLEALRTDLERVRRERESAVARRDALAREVQDLRTRQRDRLTRLRRRYHDARDRAAVAEQRVAGLAEELARILGRLTGQTDPSAAAPAEADEAATGGGTGEAAGAADAPSSPAQPSAVAVVPRGVRPAASGRPCQLPPGVAAGTPEAARALLQVDQLELLIDGYNVSKDLRGRPSATLPDQRLWLLRTVAGATAGLPVRPTIVFDAAEGVTGPSPSARGVRVIFTDVGELADDRIAAYVAAMGDDVPVCVVTSDREVRARCEAQAANTLPSGVFLRAIGASS